MQQSPYELFIPFPALKTGLSQFVWADLDGDGSSDAALIDASGTLFVLQNKRSGVFKLAASG